MSFLKLMLCLALPCHEYMLAKPPTLTTIVVRILAMGMHVSLDDMLRQTERVPMYGFLLLLPRKL